MEITANTTGMVADITVWMDPEGRDHCVCVVKGTFTTDGRGAMRLAPQQQPLVYTDEHYGDPETTSIRFENDFAPSKPQAEIVVVGKAMAPGGKPTTQVPVRLEIEGKRKDIMVMGERQWVRGLGEFVISEPVPFTEMPLVFERAFGGDDDTKGPTRVATEHRNLVGVGFHPHRKAADLAGKPLPNLERPEQRIGRPGDHPEPIGLGPLGRAWKQRVQYAGTYDQDWIDEICPFLPEDFDLHHFMTAPHDQWLPELKGGEVIRCVHMAAEPVVEYRLPTLSVPMQFYFVDRTVKRVGRLDTVIVEPHLNRAMLLWRAHVPLDKKLTNLREIVVGEPPRNYQRDVMGYLDGKPHFRDLAAATDWLHRKRSAQ